MVLFESLMAEDRPSYNKRRKAERRIRSAIKEVLPDVCIHCFGSRRTGLALPDSDIDLLMTGPDITNAGKMLRRLKKVLDKANVAAKGTKIIVVDARVPIIKFTEATIGKPVGISVNETNGVVNTAAIRAALAAAPALQPLLVVLKALLRQHGLNETHTGGVGSYLLFMMALRAHDISAYEAEISRQIGDEWGEYGEAYGEDDDGVDAWAEENWMMDAYADYRHVYGEDFEFLEEAEDAEEEAEEEEG